MGYRNGLIVECIVYAYKINKNVNSVMRLIVDFTAHIENLEVGQSISLNGTCLTITKIMNNHYCEFDITNETIKKTTIGNLKLGDEINMERSIIIGSRLDGHFVLGHIDGVGTINKLEKKLTETKIWIKIPKKLTNFVVQKGSISIDGISLTIVDIINNVFSVCIIPQTLKITNFGTKKVGDKVNIETDILAKYIIKK